MPENYNLSQLGGAALGAGVSGGFGLIGSAINYAFQKKLAAQQNQYNIDMWNMQNEYNSPMNQMKRFEEAGLNPNLIYGQGSAGNASHSPVQTVPGAPEISEDMRSLAQAFNIEGLRTVIAERKKMQAEARSAAIDARRNADSYDGELAVGHNYVLSPSGQLVLRPDIAEAGYKIPVGAGQYYQLKALENNFRNNSLLLPRANLISSTIGLNARKGELLVPQIKMANYSEKYFPYSFWLGNARTGVQSFVPLLNAW